MLRIELCFLTAVISCLGVFFTGCTARGNDQVGDAGVDGGCEGTAAEVCAALSECCNRTLQVPAINGQCQALASECDEQMCGDLLADYEQCDEEPPDAGSPDAQ